MYLLINRNADYVDFAVDQLDIKKKMKEKLGPNVVLRLKFDQHAPDSIGSKGYEIVATTEDQVELELAPLGSDSKVGETVANNADTTDSSAPLVQEEDQQQRQDGEEDQQEE